jgi:hypothetical protein
MSDVDVGGVFEALEGLGGDVVEKGGLDNDEGRAVAASHDARHASVEAFAQGTKESHQAAAIAHDTAAHKHGQVANHRDQQRFHEEKAADHRDAIETGRMTHAARDAGQGGAGSKTGGAQPVIKVGPRGGKIVGYHNGDLKQPIYAGDPASESFGPRRDSQTDEAQAGAREHSARAEKLSAAAYGSGGTAEHHAQASHFHRAAADMHAKAARYALGDGDFDAAAEHAQKAKAHAAKQAEHVEAAAKAQAAPAEANPEVKPATAPAEKPAAAAPAATTSTKPRDPRLPPVGSVIRRTYKGMDLKVLVKEDGFVMHGSEKKFKSLSALATDLAGTPQNGFLFFGLKAKEGGGAEAPEAKPEQASAPTVDHAKVVKDAEDEVRMLEDARSEYISNTPSINEHNLASRDRSVDEARARLKAARAAHEAATKAAKSKGGPPAVEGGPESPEGTAKMMTYYSARAAAHRASMTAHDTTGEGVAAEKEAHELASAAHSAARDAAKREGLKQQALDHDQAAHDHSELATIKGRSIKKSLDWTALDDVLSAEVLTDRGLRAMFQVRKSMDGGFEVEALGTGLPGLFAERPATADEAKALAERYAETVLPILGGQAKAKK